MSTEMMTCPACDNQMSALARYCSVCGYANPRHPWLARHKVRMRLRLCSQAPCSTRPHPSSKFRAYRAMLRKHSRSNLRPCTGLLFSRVPRITSTRRR